MSRHKKEQAPPGMITCLVTPKLTFSVPRDARWKTASDVPQQALQRGFAHRFPLPPVNLDKLRFESVGSTKVLNDTAVYRLTSCEEADERILASLLKGLEAAVDTKHRASLEKARTDLLASSATFQVMAGEVKERQDEARGALDREVLKLNASLATTSKRLFLLERENASLKTQTSATRSLQGETDSRLDALEAENSNLKARNASLEEALAALLERCDAHAARLDACEARAVAPRARVATVARGVLGVFRSLRDRRRELCGRRRRGRRVLLLRRRLQHRRRGEATAPGARRRHGGDAAAHRAHGGVAPRGGHSPSLR